jgi:hypothetical protein
MKKETTATQSAFTNIFSEMLLYIAKENYFEEDKLFKLSKNTVMSVLQFDGHTLYFRCMLR